MPRLIKYHTEKGRAKAMWLPHKNDFRTVVFKSSTSKTELKIFDFKRIDYMIS